MMSWLSPTCPMSTRTSMTREQVEIRAPLRISGVRPASGCPARGRKQQRCHLKNTYLAGSFAKHATDAHPDSGFFDRDGLKEATDATETPEAPSNPGNSTVSPDNEAEVDSHLTSPLNGAALEIQYPDIALLHVPGTPISTGMWSYLPFSPHFIVYCPYKAQYVSYLREIKEQNWERFTAYVFSKNANYAELLRSQKFPEYDHPETFFVSGLLGDHDYNGIVPSVDEYVLSCKSAERIHADTTLEEAKKLRIADIPEFVPEKSTLLTQSTQSHSPCISKQKKKVSPAENKSSSRRVKTKTNGILDRTSQTRLKINQIFSKILDKAGYLNHTKTLLSTSEENMNATHNSFKKERKAKHIAEVAEIVEQEAPEAHVEVQSQASRSDIILSNENLGRVNLIIETNPSDNVHTRALSLVDLKHTAIRDLQSDLYTEIHDSLCAETRADLFTVMERPIYIPKLYRISEEDEPDIEEPLTNFDEASSIEIMDVFNIVEERKNVIVADMQSLISPPAILPLIIMMEDLPQDSLIEARVIHTDILRAPVPTAMWTAVLQEPLASLNGVPKL